MGMDLRLLPLERVFEDKKWGYSHTVLSLSRNYECWEAIEKLPLLPCDGWDLSSHVGGTVPDGEAKGEGMYGYLREDAYGNPYFMVRARFLAPVLKKHLRTHPATAYIAAMPVDGLVVLDWH